MNILYKNNQIFYPQNLYLNINFENVKNELKYNYKEYEDYGSIISIFHNNFLMSVNSFGKIQVFYNAIDNKALVKGLNNVESIFQKQIKDFKILTN